MGRRENEVGKREIWGHIKREEAGKRIVNKEKDVEKSWKKGKEIEKIKKNTQIYSHK